MTKAKTKRMRNRLANGLTFAQDQVNNRLVQGFSNKEIADQLCITEKTVKFHLTAIYRVFDTAGCRRHIVKHWAAEVARIKGHIPAPPVHHVPRAGELPKGKS